MANTGKTIAAVILLGALTTAPPIALAQDVFLSDGVTGYSYQGYGSTYGSYGYGGFGPGFYGQQSVQGGLYATPYGFDGGFASEAQAYQTGMMTGPGFTPNTGGYRHGYGGYNSQTAAVGGVSPYMPRLNPAAPRFHPNMPTLNSPVPRLYYALPQLDPRLPRLDPSLPQLQNVVPRLDPAMPQLQNAVPRLNTAVPVLR